MGNAIDIPFPVFHDIDGEPLDRGYVYVGVSGLNPISNPQPVFWDVALSIPAVNPMRTSQGYVVYNGKAARPYVAGDYSIVVQDRYGKTLFSNLVNTVLDTDLLMTSSRGTLVRSMRTPPSYNLNLILESGFYSWVNQAVTNQPAVLTATDAFTLEVLSSPDGTGLVTQTLRDLTNPTYEYVAFYRRSVDGGATWSAWSNTARLDFDLIIDSNAKLDLLCQDVAGKYPRVLVKAGAWTASALGPTAGVLIDTSLSGTRYMFGEKGSSINYSASEAAGIIGIKSTASDTTDFEKFESITLNITNTNVAGDVYGFRFCSNLVNCKAVCVGKTAVFGISGGVNHISCNGTATTSSAITGAYGFNFCTNLINCFGLGTGLGASSFGVGFTSCLNLINCTGYGIGSTLSNGFAACTSLTLCTGEGTGPSGTSVAGFSTCVGLINCSGRGLNAGAGTGYGFSNCKKVQQCYPKTGAASKTATYNASYADSAAANACADTAAGGYNS